MNTHLLLHKKKLFAAMLLCVGFIAGVPNAIKAQGSERNTTLTQQRITVKGIVTDANGAIIGATVREKNNTLNGTATDINGSFSLSVSIGSTLIISYIGYETQEIKAVANQTLNLVLEQSSSSLDEVVVVGFGTQKKVNLTGAVDVVDSKQLKERPIINATQALQGLIPGLYITQNRGSLEDRPSINVRGTTTIGQGTAGAPLILIDGMEGDINAINTQDIENISVLKDAAAASIYGSRAPFGVILVTTKSGKESGKVTINYNNSFRISSSINMNHQMNSVEYGSFINDGYTNAGNAPWFGEKRMERMQKWRESTPCGPGQRMTTDGRIIYSIEPNSSGQWLPCYENAIDDVDWYDVIYKKHTFSQEHNFSASGGSKKFNYYTSFNFLDQGGYMNLGNEGYERYAANAKINSELTKWLTMNANIRFSREDYQRPSTVTDYFYEGMRFTCWPVLPVVDRNGYYISNSQPALALAEGGTDKSQTDNTYFLFNFKLEPIKNWITNVDFNYHILSKNRHWDTQVLYNHDINGTSYIRDANSNVHEDYYKENYYNLNIRSEYFKTFADTHNFHLLAGFQAENLDQTQFSLQRNGVLVSGKPEVDLTTGLDYYGNPVTPQTNGSRNSWSNAGVFGRFNYDYNGKYLFEFNLRADGSSRFRKGNQWETFPSVSIGWNLAKERFLSKYSHVVNMLKVRTSYGSLGNQNTYNWYQTFQTLSVYSANGGWIQNGVKPNTAYAPGLVSQFLTWERVIHYNLGIDWAFFNNRLTGSFNWYIRDTKDMVGNAPELPNILGANPPVTNNTDLRTKGWELSIGWRDRIKDFTYSTSFTLYDSRTKITKYGNNPTGNLDGYIEGRYINEIWGYETVGLAKTDEEMADHLATLPNGGQNGFGSVWKAGDIMYKDLNKDGKIDWGTWTIDNHGDAKLIGNHTPRFQFGLDLNGSWKGLDCRVFFQGVLKRDYWQGNTYHFGYTGDIWNTIGLTQMNNYFRNEETWSVKEGYRDVNTNSYLPRPTGNWQNLQKQTRYLQDASYIRLKNLQIGYTLPAYLTRKASIERIRIYFSGENLWTGTRLSSQFDPETIDRNDGNGYPLSKTFACGLSITF